MTVLHDACDQLTIIKVATALGIDGLKIGMNDSPFRKVSSGHPFSVYSNGHAYKDHGCPEHKGGPWKFLEQARPGMPKGERATFLIELAGLDPNSDGCSKTHLQEFKRKKRAAEYRHRADKLLEVETFQPLEEWTPTVSNHWNEGAELVPVERLAKSRGWPVEWVEWLVELDKISMPWMAWASPEYKKARRGLAFKVESPVNKPSENRILFPVGYHQRWIHADRKSGERVKDWLFYPTPKEPNRFSTLYQRSIFEERRRVYPFPFVLGCMDSPRNVIVTEGQWDAISVYGAAGWFNDAAPVNTAVFGLRGSQSIEVFLSHYGRWMRDCKPNILLLPDNDAAGRAWIEQPESNQIIEKPTFADRLRGWGAARVTHRSIDPKYGKDFNDYWKARKPGVNAVLDWLIDCGLVLQ